ncbi:MAG: alpha/beta hydrolase [Rhodospirillaceae bacterium]
MKPKLPPSPAALHINTVFGLILGGLILGGLISGGTMGKAIAAEPSPEFSNLEIPDGARLRLAYWRPSSLAPELTVSGTVVMLTGRSEYLEKYQELAGDWLQRGYQVFSLDWRGQGLSSRFLSNHQKGHVTDYSVYVSDLALLLETVVKPREIGPTILFAHSMGGLVALRFLIDQPGRFKAVVLSAPMVDINTEPWPRFAAEMLSRAAGAFGFSGAYAFGQGDYNPIKDAKFEGNTISGDQTRFRRIHDGYRNNPELKIGGVTFGWLTASFRSQTIVAMPGALDNVRIPILALVAPGDALVPEETQRLLCQKLHDCTLMSYPGARHDIMAETDTFRSQAWHDIDGFLTRKLGR